MASFDEHRFFHSSQRNSCAVDSILEFFFRSILPVAASAESKDCSEFAATLLRYYHRRLQVGFDRAEGVPGAEAAFEALRDEFRNVLWQSAIAADFLPPGRDDAILDNVFTLFRPSTDCDALNVGFRQTVRCTNCGVIQQHSQLCYCVVDVATVLNSDELGQALTVPQLHCFCGLEGSLVVDHLQLADTMVFEVSALSQAATASWCPAVVSVADSPYTLVAAVVHRLGRKAGHFFTVVRTESNQWRVFDDCVPSFVVSNLVEFLRLRNLALLYVAYKRCSETRVCIDGSRSGSEQSLSGDNCGNSQSCEQNPTTGASRFRVTTQDKKRMARSSCSKTCCDVVDAVDAYREGDVRRKRRKRRTPPLSPDDVDRAAFEVVFEPPTMPGTVTPPQGSQSATVNSCRRQRKMPKGPKKTVLARNNETRTPVPNSSTEEGCKRRPQAKKQPRPKHPRLGDEEPNPSSSCSPAYPSSFADKDSRLTARMEQVFATVLERYCGNQGSRAANDIRGANACSTSETSATDNRCDADSSSVRKQVTAEGLAEKQRTHVPPIVNIQALSPSVDIFTSKLLGLSEPLTRVERAYKRRLKVEKTLPPYLPFADFDVHCQNLRVRRKLLACARRAKSSWPQTTKRPKTKLQQCLRTLLRVRHFARLHLAYGAKAMRLAVPIWYRRSPAEMNMLKTAYLKFRQATSVAAWHICKICGRMQDNVKKPSLRRGVLAGKAKFVCLHCRSLLRNHSVSSVEEIMRKFFEPGNAPPELLDLTVVERRHIMLLHAYMSLIVLPGATGQWAHSGQMYAFSANVSEMVAELYPIGKTEDLIVVQYEKSDGSLAPVRLDRPGNYLRPAKVLAALRWLKRNNILYSSAIDTQLLQEWHAAVFFNTPSEEDQGRYAAFENLDVDSAIPVDFVTPNVDVHFKLTGRRDATTVRLHRMKKRDGNFYDVCETGTPFEEMSHPHLFPFGKNGLNEERDPKLTASKYFVARLLGSDMRFQQDVVYLFFALNVLHRRFISSQISVALRKNTLAGQGVFETLTAADLRKPSKELLKNCFSFLSHLRGSHAYMRQILYQLLAKVKMLGPPTWFHTLSAADCSDLWPQLFDLLRHPKYDLPSAKLAFEHRLQMLRKNPVLTARHFMRRFKSYLTYFLKSPLHPLGKVTDHFARVEFQKRGSPHIHMFLWVKGAPDVTTPSGRAALPAFLDRYISTVLPSERLDPAGRRLVARLQTHKCNAVCTSRYRRCRFSFPHALTARTKLALRRSLRKSPRFYEMQRIQEEDRRINAFNMEVEKIWCANHDIQFVGSARDVCAYVCSYLMKDEPSGLINDVCRKFCQLPPDSTTRQKLLAIGNAILK